MWETVTSDRGRQIALTEEQQRDRYRAYVEGNIGDVLAEKELCVLGVEKGINILTVQVPGRNIEPSGWPDLLILSDVVLEEPADLKYLPGVKMLIEAKRKVEDGDEFQALSELIALDLLAKDPVMALLTDTATTWRFFWVSDMTGTHVTVHKTSIKAPGSAFQVVQSLLAHASTGDADVRLPGFQVPIKRRKLVEMLPSVNEGGESGGVRAAIERYFAIASVLGPDIEMAGAVASQVTRSIPVFSPFYIN